MPKAAETFEELAEILREGLCPAVRSNPAVALFVRNRSTFEGWLKVELCRVLIERGWPVSPEETIPGSSKRVDLKAGRWWLELKTLSTNYDAIGAYRESSRSISQNIQGVIADIRKLREHRLTPAAIIFVVSPLPDPRKDAWPLWDAQLQKIRADLGGQAVLEEFTIDFPAIPGRLYLAST